MKLKVPTISFFFFLISSSTSFLEASNNGDGAFIFEEIQVPQIKRSDFSSGFLFGTATSAYQVEGAYLEDGKSLSNWDVFCHSLGCGENGENGDIADDHYHLFMDDIELMHSLGVQAYRFSISWARILPRGSFGEINSAGIMFYNKIIDNLILKGIEPFVTIHHGDFPQELEDIYGSWLNPEMQEEFMYLAEICFKSFGDRVKYWITINEPKLTTEFAYEFGTIPPSHCSEPFGNCLDGNSDLEPIIVMHNKLLAHGRAAKLYHEHFQVKQCGSIGLAVNSYMYEPLTDSELDHKAAKRAFAFHAGWTLDPSIFGEYPEEVKDNIGSELPSFSIDEKKFMKTSTDFIGINHYSTIYVKDCTNLSCSTTESRAIRGFVGMVGERNGVLIGERMGLPGSYVVPRGMEKLVNFMKIRYDNKPMFITENGNCHVFRFNKLAFFHRPRFHISSSFTGYSSPDVHEQRVNELTNDVKRVEYHTKYLASLAKSISGGADVRGYFAWSLIDCYEWTQGYDVRFGFYYVDRVTLTRIPKLSARWYKNFLANKSDFVEKEHHETQIK